MQNTTLSRDDRVAGSMIHHYGRLYTHCYGDRRKRNLSLCRRSQTFRDPAIFIVAGALRANNLKYRQPSAASSVDVRGEGWGGGVKIKGNWKDFLDSNTTNRYDCSRFFRVNIQLYKNGLLYTVDDVTIVLILSKIMEWRNINPMRLNYEKEGGITFCPKWFEC